MNGRRMEVLLWIVAVAVLLLGWSRWRRAEPSAAPPETALTAAPVDPARVPRDRLAEAGRSVAGANPFRLDRAPAPIGFDQPPAPGMPGLPGAFPGAPPGYAPPPPPRPQLSVSGIVGPPWQAMLEGVPGREGAVVVRAGDLLGDLRVREITRTTVVVAAPDTTWRLTVRNPWQ